MSDYQFNENSADMTSGSSPSLLADSKPRFSKGKIAAIAGGGIGLIGVGIFAAFALLSGGGTQPEAILPSDTVALAKIDLNPSAGQKINFVRFVSKFPSTFKGFNSDDPVGSFINQAELGDTINWSEAKNWIGNRYAIAGVESSNGVEPILVLAVKDESAMKYYFAKHNPDMHFFTKSGYAVLSSHQSTLDLISTSPKHLTDNPLYNEDVKALGGDQVAIAWADSKRFIQAERGLINNIASNNGLSNVTKTLEAATGRFVLGIHFTSSSVAATFLTRGAPASTLATLAQSTANVSDLPENTLVGVSISGIGGQIADSLSSDSNGASLLSSLGIRPSDLKALFSGPVSLIVLPGNSSNAQPLVALRLSPTNSTSALSAIRRLTSSDGILGALTSQIEIDGSNIYLGEDKGSIQQVISRVRAKGSLGQTASYKDSVTRSGFLVAYVNLERLLSVLDIKGEGRSFSGAGLVASVDKSSSGSSKTTLTLSLKK